MAVRRFLSEGHGNERDRATHVGGLWRSPTDRQQDRPLQWKFPMFSRRLQERTRDVLKESPGRNGLAGKGAAGTTTSSRTSGGNLHDGTPHAEAGRRFESPQSGSRVCALLFDHPEGFSDTLCNEQAMEAPAGDGQKQAQHELETEPPPCPPGRVESKSAWSRRPKMRIG